MNLTREQVNALRTRDEIQTCNTCGRILHLSSTSAQATAPSRAR
jgi:predicted  nucleic acid-binding Zn-ribbon protein